MSSHERCHRCQDLPIITSARGVVQRCPLCAGALIRSGDATYRVETATAGENVGVGRRVLQLVLGTLSAVLLVGALIAAICYATFQNMEHSQLITAAPTTQGDDDWSNFTIPPPKPLPSHLAPAAITEVDGPRTAPASPTQFASGRNRQRAVGSIRAAAPMVAAADEGRGQSRIWLEEFTPEDFASWIQHTPEVSLVRAQSAKSQSEMAAVERNHRVHLLTLAKRKSELINHLIKTNSDLAGLPFLLGNDCEISSGRAAELAEHSQGMRELLSREARRTVADEEHQYSEPRFFVRNTLESRTLGRNEGVPAYHQILSGEDTSMRMGLVMVLEKMSGKDAARALAKRAVFDSSAAVRQRAINALRDAPADAIAPELLAGLRYPLAPVVSHAAAALVALNMKVTVPELVNMLDQPDPGEPVLKNVNGRETFIRRELVRINHMRNCLLCHAPTTSKDRNEVPGLAPILGTPLPPRLVSEYSVEARCGIFVRADITYLRQDFSALQFVPNAEPWPDQQRFDFLVRERALTCSELDDWQERAANAHRPMSHHRRALLFVLQSLTGAEFGNDAAAWKNYLASR